MLSSRELEPLFVYERASKEFDVFVSPAGIDEMVTATERIYFPPQRR
jgi:hypothetical protein